MTDAAAPPASVAPAPAGSEPTASGDDRLGRSAAVITAWNAISRLTGFARVPLEPGEERRVTFRLHADRTAFTGRARTRIVEPGEIGVAVGGASDRLPLRGSFTLAGPE